MSDGIIAMFWFWGLLAGAMTLVSAACRSSDRASAGQVQFWTYGVIISFLCFVFFGSVALVTTHWG